MLNENRLENDNRLQTDVRKKTVKDKRRDEEMEALREELRRLREELETLRRQVAAKEQGAAGTAKAARPWREQRKRLRDRWRQMGESTLGFGRDLGEYIKLVIGDVMSSVDRTLRRSIFVGPRGRGFWIRNGEEDVEEGVEGPVRRVDPEQAQRLLSPLASAERIKLLYLLSEGPRYHQDLMRDSGLQPGTLPHHLKQLEEAGYVTQERVRGRYLITIPGRMALKLVEYLYYQMHSSFEDGEGGEGVRIDIE